MRVGLIAMSGVRVYNPKLLELGVTLPQFVNRGQVIAQLPSLALLLLAARTPADVDVEYLELDDVRACDPAAHRFDLVAITSYTAMAYDMYDLADRFRAAGVAVVIGGLHASFAPDEAREHADAVCVGEGEDLWPRILDDFSRGGRAALQPFYREAAPGTYDLSHSPMPRFDLLLGRRYNRITVQTVRGCPLDCEFCGASKLYGPKYRRKPLDKVLAEIRRIKDLWGDNAFFELADDNSFANRRWAKEFLTAIQDFDLRWFTETDISIADDDELLRLLAKSGCRQILIGLESINPGALDGIDRANWKLKRLQHYRDAIRKIQSHGVTVNGCFIVGNDADDPGVFEALRDFIERSELLEAQVTILTPFPGTHLLRRLRAEGRLLYDRLWDKCTLFDLVFQPKRMTPDELVEGHSWLMSQIYNQAQYTRRKRHYVNIMKALELSWFDGERTALEFFQ
ncbi:MAG TPA: radical SAM protein [Gemmatimonadaceae bacterium]|nr:radical SAM protein [Vicinamibacterales bacterium]